MVGAVGLGVFIVILIPSSLLRLEQPVFGFGALQVFFHLALLIVLSIAAAVRVVRRWTSYTVLDRATWLLVMVLLVLVGGQLISRPSLEGLGFAAGLVVLLLGIQLSTTFRFSNRRTSQTLITSAVFLCLVTNFLWLLVSNYEADVRLTYSLALISPVLMQIGWDRRTLYEPAYFLAWGIYVFSAWQELRASSLIVGVVLGLWALAAPLDWRKRVITFLLSVIALFGLWQWLILKPLFIGQSLYVSARNKLLKAATESDSAASEEPLQRAFGSGPGVAKQNLIEAGYDHADLHSVINTLVIDYGWVTSVAFVVFFAWSVLRISRVRISTSMLSDFRKWAPALSAGGAFAVMSLVYDVVVVFETLSVFLLALIWLSSESLQGAESREPVSKL